MKHSLYANHVRWCHKNPRLGSYKKSNGADKRYGVAIERDLKCPTCGKGFTKVMREAEYARRHPKIYCSRSCANSRNWKERQDVREKISKALVNNKERHVYTVESAARTLATREWGKYEDIAGFLDKFSIQCEFEKVIGQYIYDIYIPSSQLLIELDGPYHMTDKDEIKDQLASMNNLRIIRIMHEDKLPNLREFKEALMQNL